jgi:hypothetical protein
VIDDVIKDGIIDPNFLFTNLHRLARSSFESSRTTMAPARGPDSARQVTFTLSGPSSVASSRTASPAPTPPTSLREEYLLEKVALDDPGCRPMDVYDVTLPAWRAAVRRVLVAQIRIESVLVAKMQASARF